jgi:hypothetical protein
MRHTSKLTGRGPWRMAMMALLLGGLAITLPARVQEIRPKPNSNWGRDRGMGEMNIRLHLEEEAEIAVRGDRMFIRTISGAWAREYGSNMSAPLPQREVTVDMSRRIGRGRAWVVEQPTQRNRFTLILRIHDTQGGEGRYHIRLRYRTGSWGWQSRFASLRQLPGGSTRGAAAAKHETLSGQLIGQRWFRNRGFAQHLDPHDVQGPLRAEAADAVPVARKVQAFRECAVWRGDSHIDSADGGLIGAATRTGVASDRYAVVRAGKVTDTCCKLAGNLFADRAVLFDQQGIHAS